MIRTILITIVITFVMNFGCTRIVEEDEAKNEIQLQLKLFYTALEAEDEAGLISTIETDSTIHMPPVFSDGRIISDKASLVDEYRALFRFIDDIKIWRKNEQINLIGLGECAIVTSINHTQYKQENETVAENYFVTTIMEKHGRQWRITHFHQTLLNDSNIARRVETIDEPVNIEPTAIYQDTVKTK